MRPVRVVVAGSVDDGKSTLLGRLLHDAQALLTDEVSAVRSASGPALNLAYFTDGLVQERAQGITVDVATRHLTLGTRRLLLADAPGHPERLSNLATGASTADAGLLLVDVVRGVRPQTERHLAVMGGLGVPLVVACLNKLDAVTDPAARVAELMATLRPLVPSGMRLEVVPLSAKDGDNVVRRSDRWPWYAGPTLAQRLEGLEPVAAGSAAFRAVVQLSQADGWTALVPCGDAAACPQVVAAWPGGEALRVVERSAASATRVRFDRPVARGTLLSLPEEPPVLTASPRLLVTWLASSPLIAGQTLWLLQLGLRTKVLVRAVAQGSLGWGQVGWVDCSLEAATWFDAESVCRRTSRALLVDERGDTVAGARLP